MYSRRMTVRASSNASFTQSALTSGLPSRSPPIHDPKLNSFGNAAESRIVP
jgi:hypothetical protein